MGRGVVGAGVGLLTGSAFSIWVDFGVGVSALVPFFFGEGDLSAAGVGLFFDFAAGDLPAAGVGLFFFDGVFVGCGDSSDAVSSSSSSSATVAFGVVVDFGEGDASASPGLFFALGVLVGSGVAVPFALVFPLGVGVGVAFNLRVAGFGFAVGEADGVGDVTARISSRAFFVSSVDCAWTSDPAMTPSTSRVRRKRRSRITASERNKAGCVINLRTPVKSRGLRHRGRGRSRRRPFAFAPQNRV